MNLHDVFEFREICQNFWELLPFENRSNMMKAISLEK